MADRSGLAISSKAAPSANYVRPVLRYCRHSSPDDNSHNLTRYTFAFRATNDIGEMTMAIVALLRIVCSSVTVDAAWRSQDRIDLFPRSQPIGEPGIRRKGF